MNFIALMCGLIHLEVMPIAFVVGLHAMPYKT